MLNIIYHKDHIEFQENVAPEGWKPLWNTFLQANNLTDIGKTLFARLSEEEIDSVYYFFFDLETIGD